MQLEIERYNRLNFINSTIEVNGAEIFIDPKSEIIIFRILQEFLSNTIKHSKGTILYFCMNYGENNMQILARDNGIGFDKKKIKKNEGIGLQNIENRAKLIGAKIELVSHPKIGTTLTINYTF